VVGHSIKLVVFLVKLLVVVRMMLEAVVTGHEYSVVSEGTRRVLVMDKVSVSGIVLVLVRVRVDEGLVTVTRVSVVTVPVVKDRMLEETIVWTPVVVRVEMNVVATVNVKLVSVSVISNGIVIVVDWVCEIILVLVSKSNSVVVVVLVVVNTIVPVITGGGGEAVQATLNKFVQSLLTVVPLV
jgi:hypothetical protein